jgi:hypothetical protein
VTRELPEWLGAHDDQAIPPRVKRRIVLRGEGRCTGPCHRAFNEKLKPQFDHRPPLCLGGQHRETMIFAVCRECHSLRTALDVKAKAKTADILNKRYGLTQSRHVIPGSKRSKFKKKVSGEVLVR